MKTSDFNFELPENLIAQVPCKKREDSRLMTLNRVTGQRLHKTVLQLPQILCEKQFLSPNGEPPLLIFNDTKTRKARLTGKSLKTGSAAEFFLLERADNESENQNDEWKTIVQRAKRRKTGSQYVFFDANGVEINKAEITREEGEFRYLRFLYPVNDEWLDKYGAVPLPPYIKRKDNPRDAERYQTVYAKQTGSVASPTAGLHFTDKILEDLKQSGVGIAFITLHVGLGTFMPVRSEDIENHVMHEEQFLINEEVAVLIENAIKNKRKIIAVGTTSLRSLESAFYKGRFKQGWQKTSIFIYPGYKFNVVDALFTNFHTPFSTLLMLVSAFAGRELILESYAEAVLKEYRFFSYGDAMLIY
jgi:S-adenosylmethionine:tRNA ribosyltransferase-isomerase